MESTQKAAQAIGKNPTIVQPLGNYLTVRLFKPDEKTAGGIALPENARDRQALAEVIATGPGQRSIVDGQFLPCYCKPGDLIIVLKHAPTEIKLGGETFHVVFEGDVIGRVDREELDALLAIPDGEVEGEVLEENDQQRAIQRESGLLIVETKHG